MKTAFPKPGIALFLIIIMVSALHIGVQKVFECLLAA